MRDAHTPTDDRGRVIRLQRWACSPAGLRALLGLAVLIFILVMGAQPPRPDAGTPQAGHHPAP